MTPVFVGAVIAASLAYTALGFTPSSYGTLLKQIKAPESGPMLGSAREVRSDEWGIMTPLFQASVRNGFKRYNATSFYNEDLRNFYALPLRDWGLLFRPQLWLFFLTPPATAYAFYWAFLFAAFLIGYHLLFLELGFPPLVSTAAALSICFCGYSQFWWTTVASLLGGLAWIAWIILRPMKAVWKFVLLTYGLAWWALSHFYVPFLAELALTILVLVVAFRPQALKSPALAAAAIASAAIVGAYFWDVIPVMRATIYPGHRIAPPGLVHPASWGSQFYPFLNFSLTDFEPLIRGDYHTQDDPTLWWNIYEVSATGSFLPILAACFINYTSLIRNPKLLRTLLILIAAFLVMTLWEIAPAPLWLGRILYWDRVFGQRLLFSSGLLIAIASLAVWRSELLSITWSRVLLFVAAGPVAAVLLKRQVFHVLEIPDLVVCSLLAAAAIAIRLIPAASRPTALLLAVAAVNVYVFARFNPIQPARPIFEIPDTQPIRTLRAEAAQNAGVLVESDYLAATLNGLGFRSVSHTLMSPQLKLFRGYFPVVSDLDFDTIFNRFAHVRAVEDPWPAVRGSQEIRIPAEPFRMVRNVREAIIEPPFRGACNAPTMGYIDRVSTAGSKLILEGWARWRSENSEQGVRVLTSRNVDASVATTSRFDIATSLRDYRYAKAGFKLTLQPRDHGRLEEKEIVVFAFGTASGGGLVHGAGCP